jgi:nucleolar protein 6
MVCRAGGGGNKKNRHAKINEKNQKLNEERIRRMQEEDKAKLAKKDLASDHNGVHPSRRARVLEIS